MSPIAAHALYALSWLSFALVHSLLLNESVRARMRPLTGGRCRLVYTIVSVLHFGAVMAVAGMLFGDAPPFDVPPWAWIGWGAVFLAGATIMWIGFRPFYTARFLGLTTEDETSDTLVVQGIQRHIRHPLYGGGILVLWGLATNEGGVATAIWGTLYLIVGAMIEEERLRRRFGQAYVDYCERVPRFIPRLR